MQLNYLLCVTTAQDAFNIAAPQHSKISCYLTVMKVFKVKLVLMVKVFLAY